VVEVDNELTTQKPDVRNYLENTEFMKVEPSAPYTQGQNGGAERSGGVLKDEIRTMAIGANFQTNYGQKFHVRRFTFITESRNTLTTGNRRTTDFTRISLIEMV
jgi:hypothetical protein